MPTPPDFRPIASIRSLLTRVLLVAACLTSSASTSAGASGDPRDVLPPPLEQPGDPPLAPARPTGPSRAGARPNAVYTFDRFTHIQVNVDAGGSNIPGDAANEPSIAVDPNNHNRMAIGWRQFDNVASNFREAGVAYSVNGGASWVAGTLDNGVFRSDPVLGFDAAGNFYYSSLTNSGGLHTWVFRSSDGGATWGAPVFSNGGDKQWITVDRTFSAGHGHLYQAWSTAGNTYGPDTFDRSTDGALSWNGPSFMPDSPLWGTLDVAPDGTLYVAGRSPTSSWNFVARSTDAKFAGIIPPTFTTVSADLGGIISTGPPNGSGLVGQAYIAVDRSPTARNGWIYVLSSVRTPTDPLDVMFIRSTDGGDTWSTPVKVNDDPGGTRAHQWFGTMSVSADGRIDAVWNDTRGSSDSTLSALYYSCSTDGGSTWTPNEQASAQWNCTVGYPNQSKIGDYYHMISDETGADLAWAATFNGEQDVYYTRITPPPFLACPATAALTSGVPTVATADPNWYRVTPAAARWSAVALRPQDAADWNLEAWDATDPSWNCFAGSLGNTGFGPHVMVTDWRHRALQTDYVRAATPFDTGVSALVEYEQAVAETQPNTAFVTIATGPSDVLSVHEAQMYAGVPYRIRVVPSAGLNNLHMMIFAPVASGSGWLSAAYVTAGQILVGGTENVFDFGPSVDGVYGIVILNQDGAAGSFQFAVGRCPFYASTPAENTPFFIGVLDDWPGFTPVTPTWAAVGIRGAFAPFNLDVAPFPRSQVGPFFACTDSILGSQYSGLGVRLVTVDLRATPLRTYTGHASVEGQPNSVPSGYWEWNGGSNTVVVNDPPLHVSPGADNVLDAWSVSLLAGGSYQFSITPAGGATAQYRLLLFGNPNPGTPCWANRADALLETSGTGAFVPGATGLYGLVVVNDNGGSGEYDIEVTGGLVSDVGGRPATWTDEVSVSPSPASGPVRIAYQLARPGSAAIAIRDVTGRIVTSPGAEVRPAGPASWTWNGLGRDGRRMAAGVYFVSLSLDGREVARTRLVVLR